MQTYMVDPIRTPAARGLSSRAESQASLVGGDKERVFSMESMQSPPFQSQLRPETKHDEASVPLSLTTTKTSFPSRTHAAKPSYSLFPVELRNSTPKSPQKPYSIYDISGLEPPPPIAYTQGPRHRRDSSMMSSATVQIGLRISNAPPTTKPKKESCEPLPSTTYAAPSLPLPASKLSELPMTSSPTKLPVPSEWTR